MKLLPSPKLPQKGEFPFDNWFIWLAIIGVIVNASGLLLPILEPDGALYATIAKNMAQSGDYVKLMMEGNDWLDKPHFPFWITAFSFKLFGINSFAYKLPGLLFWLAGMYYTYAFANKLYNKQTAQWAVLIYISIEHLILSNNDVRAEPFLTGLMIGAAYYYYLAYRNNKLTHYVAGSLLLAFAVMTKGIFIACMVMAGFVIEWIIKKDWKQFLNYRWWLSIILMLVFILPELIALYLQFDQHPEKLVFGQHHVSGIRFFFWDSQFGRFFNTGPIKGKGDKLFYVHTLLWAFLPWSVIFFMMVGDSIKNYKTRLAKTGNYICSGISLTGFLVFSLSRFQLPHYLNILYPFFAIILATWLLNLQHKGLLKAISYTQNTLYYLFFAACIGLLFIVGLPFQVLTVVILAFWGFVIMRLFPGNSLQPVLLRSFAVIMVVNLFLNTLFYPALFKYQSGNAAAATLNVVHQGPVYMFNGVSSEYAFQFYYKRPVHKIDTHQLDTIKNNIVVYTSQVKVDSLKRLGYQVQVMQQFPHFHISQLTGKFLYYKKRDQAIDHFVIATLSANVKRQTANITRDY
ncbi:MULTISPECIES: ArnT family glycosyltransferase [Niastella]|uniref:Glycosyltransferase family 39 protein n=1 Tax=Niastella soli TaxID=2821487 RepID=A0ABS3Z6S7_9BACT|nr:glycosyltransferase family 39 protein [Niastella soli]MBO9205166.1 glycosyltransferase family 39 protein [Niastella soli]